MRSGRPRRVPAAVWALTALHLSLLVLYTLLYPPYLGPDEPQHVDMVVALRSGDGWPDPGERTLSLGVYRTSDPIYPQGDVEALPRPYRPDQFSPRGLRPSLEEAGGNAPSVGALPNQLVQHPPLYYAMGALVLELAPGELPYDRSLALLRLLSVVLVAPLPLLCWAATRLVVPGAAVAAAAVPLAVPGLTRIGAMAGNDSLIVLAGAAATVALLRVGRGDLSLRTAAATGGLVTLALLAKGFGLVFVPLLALAYGVAAIRGAGRAVLRPLLVAGAVAAVGGLWWLRNLVRYGVVQPNGFGDEAAAGLLGERRAPGSSAELAPFVRDFAELITTRFWAGLGVVEPPTFPLLLAAALTVLALLLGLAAVTRRRTLDLLLALAPLTLVLGLTVRTAWSSYVAFGRDPGVQGRYLYVGVAGLAVAIGIGAYRLLGRWAALTLLVGALTLQVYAVVLVTEDFYGERVREAVIYIAPWPGWVVGAVLLLTGLAAAVSLRALLRTQPRLDAEGAADRSSAASPA